MPAIFRNLETTALRCKLVESVGIKTENWPENPLELFFSLIITFVISYIYNQNICSKSVNRQTC